jgi:hypothetical protein
VRGAWPGVLVAGARVDGAEVAAVPPRAETNDAVSMGAPRERVTASAAVTAKATTAAARHATRDDIIDSPCDDQPVSIILAR